MKEGKQPVYSVNGSTDTLSWNYSPFVGSNIQGNMTMNLNANGYRLPTVSEWKYAAKGGKSYKYAGSNNINLVAWYQLNSGNNTTHPVGKKMPNSYGLYDMSGNVYEWCWDAGKDNPLNERFICGGSYSSWDINCEVENTWSVYSTELTTMSDSIGFRLVCKA